MKIAFCCVGRTANNRNTTKSGVPFVVEFLRSKGHSVDVYGMTWDTCEASTYSGCVDYSVISEAEFEKWLSQDLDNRVSVTSTYRHRRGTEFDASDSTDILESAKAAHVQLYMFGKVVKRVLTTQKQYDIIIKWRWDLCIGDRWSYVAYNPNISPERAIMNIIEDTLTDFYYKKRESGYEVLAGTGLLHITDGADGMIFDERMMAFTFTSVKNLFKKFRNIESLLDDINEGTFAFNRGANGHTGWLNFSRRLSPRILCGLPINSFILYKN